MEVEHTPPPRLTDAYEVMDSSTEPVLTLEDIRFPEHEYNALARLWQAEEDDERHRPENELMHQIRQHEDECSKTHYYRAGDEIRYCCSVCMPWRSQLFGMQRYIKVEKEAA